MQFPELCVVLYGVVWCGVVWLDMVAIQIVSSISNFLIHHVLFNTQSDKTEQ